ncbi:MAG: hypothetical protein ABID61_02850 [Candidatus Micrarchaeota archaeon]
MYTTSRYSSIKTRELAKKLANENNEIYVARGKKTIDQLVQLARKKGEERITVLDENNPTTFAIIEVDELGNWKWVTEVCDYKC